MIASIGIKGEEPMAKSIGNAPMLNIMQEQSPLTVNFVNQVGTYSYHQF
jgi:hypothetical protein